MRRRRRARLTQIRAGVDRAAGTLLLLGVLTATCLLCVEGIARWVAEEPPASKLPSLPTREVYADVDWAEQYFADLRGFDRYLVYEPWSLWQEADYESTTFNVRDGHRATWVPPRGDVEPRETVYVFGGSTVFGAEVPDDHTLPSYLAKSLDRAASRAQAGPIVRNFGVSGFTSDNSVHLLVELLKRGHRPEQVVFYDGVNDVRFKVGEGLPHFMYERFRPVGEYSWRGLVARAARRFRLVAILTRSLPAVGGGRHRDLAKRSREMIGEYLSNVQLVRRLAAAYGFEAHFFWQPTLFSTNKELTGEERLVLRAMHELAAEVDAVDADLERSGALAQHGIEDLRGALDEVTSSVFLDYCHVNALANQTIAREMAERMQRRSASSGPRVEG